MLLAQPVPVVGARLTGGHFRLGERFDQIQRLEVFQRLCRTTARLLLSLHCIHEHPSGVGQATEVRRPVKRSPGSVTISHQHAIIAGKHRLRMFLAATRLVIEQYHRLIAFLCAAVHPHVGLALRCLARLI